MLKKRGKLFLGLVVCLAGSACVTPTHASSAQNVIITSIQAGASSGAKEELVVLYNPSSFDVDVTGWCLTNKSDVQFACLSFDSDSEQVTATLPAYGYLTIASREYALSHSYTDDFYSLIYTVTNQSSGSIIGSADSIYLSDSEGEVVDSRVWTTSLASGKAWVRVKLMANPDVYATTSDVSDWMPPQTSIDPPQTMLIFDSVPIEEIPPIEVDPGTSQTTLPNLLITELLANPGGVDTGKEFIELYNPSLVDTVSLNDIFLRVGFDKPKWYAFPEGASILPKAYAVFYSNELGFTLTNTTGKVQLYKADTAIGDAVEYSTAKDDESWALIGSTWQYTSVTTPGAPNKPSPPKPIKAKAATSTHKPCASNQYRNPVTNRCRLKSSSATTQTPCKVNQERNPETHRCRNIKKMSDANYKVSGIESSNNQTRWYYWAAIFGIVALIIGYGVWEWRDELKMVGRKVRGLFRRKTGLY